MNKCKEIPQVYMTVGEVAPKWALLYGRHS